MSHHTVDDFKGNDGLLIQCIDSLLAMDAKGILVPHGIGGHARTLLKASKAALEQAAQSVPPKPDYSVTQLQRMKSLMGELGLATDESLEAFCLDADRQLSRVITAMEKFMAKQSVPVVGEPVAWAVPVATQTGQPDTKLSWTESGARIGVKVGESTPLYLKPVNSISAAELEQLQKDAERMQKALTDIAEWTERYTTPGHPISNIARAAIAAEENSHE